MEERGVELKGCTNVSPVEQSDREPLKRCDPRYEQLPRGARTHGFSFAKAEFKAAVSDTQLAPPATGYSVIAVVGRELARAERRLLIVGNGDATPGRDARRSRVVIAHWKDNVDGSIAVCTGQHRCAKFRLGCPPSPSTRHRSPRDKKSKGGGTRAPVEDRPLLYPLPFASSHRAALSAVRDDLQARQQLRRAHFEQAAC